MTIAANFSVRVRSKISHKYADRAVIKGKRGVQTPLFSTVAAMAFGLMLTPLTWAQASFETAGKLAIETNVFASKGQFDGQDYQHNLSVALAPELYWSWDDDTLLFKPFARLDEQDAERTHFDVRELLWTHVADDWEMRAGIGKVFWGVTEFNHLVDVINQSDGVDSFNGEKKLGQPMIVLSTVTDSGIVDAYLLPGFREQTFAGKNGRLRAGLVVDGDNATYESSQKQQHVDFALRWSHSVDVFDFGVYGFQGTDRSPVFSQVSQNGAVVLQPYYQQSTQFGVDAQATIDSWLWKFEAISKSTKDDDYVATQAGFEYSFYGIADSVADLGVLVEYGWDERGKKATAIAQNDVYIGGRITFNDTDNTALLMGVSYDNDYHSKTALLEASQRLNDYWTVALEASVFVAGNSQDPVANLDKDDRLQFTLERYF